MTIPPEMIEAVAAAIEIARGLTKAQREAVLEGRVHDCPYNHPKGTRCPNCSRWPFKKGEAADFVLAVRQHIKEGPTHER